MTIVSNPSADSAEKIEHAAKILRQSKQAKEVFKFVYKGKRAFKPIEEMQKGISGFNKNTYKAAGRLAAEDIVAKKSVNRKVWYGKIEFYTYNHEKIIRLSENHKRLKEFPTKRNLSISLQKNTFIFRSNPKARFITVDEIESFNKIKNITNHSLPDVKEMSERTVNRGICRILGATEKKDWGGEKNDIFSTNVQIDGKRIAAAFALKARGTKGMLYPIKMGKNGDQIPRLFEGVSRVYFVVHNDVVNEAVYDLMQTHAIQKSIETNDVVYYCVVDGKDLSRLVAAYPESFSHDIPNVEL